jgi:hypothetical protein
VGPFDVSDAVAPTEFEPGLLLPESDVLDRVERARLERAQAERAT